MREGGFSDYNDLPSTNHYHDWYNETPSDTGGYADITGFESEDEDMTIKLEEEEQETGMRQTKVNYGMNEEMNECGMTSVLTTPSTTCNTPGMNGDVFVIESD